MGFRTVVTPSVAVRKQPVNIAYSNKPSAVQYRRENAVFDALTAQQQYTLAMNKQQYYTTTTQARVLSQKYADTRSDR